jgi:hypothetical protein
MAASGGQSDQVREIKTGQGRLARVVWVWCVAMSEHVIAIWVVWVWDLGAVAPHWSGQEYGYKGRVP